MQSKWWVRIATGLVWALAAASVVYWALRLTAAPRPPAAVTVARAGASASDPQALARMLGAVNPAAASAQAAPASSRFSLVGVVAARSRTGAALIAIDGKPAKPFRVGSQIEEGYVLKSVQTRSAVLAPSMDGDPSVTLELPVRK